MIDNKKRMFMVFILGIPENFDCFSFPDYRKFLSGITKLKDNFTKSFFCTNNNSLYDSESI